MDGGISFMPAKLEPIFFTRYTIEAYSAIPPLLVHVGSR